MLSENAKNAVKLEKIFVTPAQDTSFLLEDKEVS